MSYADVTGHHSMVFDGVRNSAYARAMARVIGADTTVMDLGAGLGIHGLIAAKLGAREVHLVEPSPVLEAARQVARDNGLRNVHFHPCRVEDLKLQEKIDVLVSVFTGNFLLSEDLLPSLFRARDRFLAPGGALIPDRARMEVVPVSAPVYFAKHVDQWRDFAQHFRESDIPDLDYSAVRVHSVNTLFHDRRHKFDAELLACPAPLLELNLATATDAGCDCDFEFTLDKSGTVHGWLGWFQMRLGQEWLTTAGEPEQTHWSPVFMPLETPLQVAVGDTLYFALKRPQLGEWTWTTEFKGSRQRQSTFLSQPLSMDQVKKASDEYKPSLNDRGAAAAWLLQHMTGGATVNELAQQALQDYPDTFVDQADALSLAKTLAKRYS